jgi:NAD(P)-dependent dehydrogenase (short-subunit alcohol dehydrogenase family)
MEIRGMKVVVTGGSRGLGLGLVEAMVAHGAKVTVVARSADALESVRAQLGVATVSADVTDAAAANQVLHDTRPDILVLNAGAKPPMGRLDKISWDDFAATWETDVKAGFHWLHAVSVNARWPCRSVSPPHSCAIPTCISVKCFAVRSAR